MAPYLINSDLPLAIRLDLPPAAQFAFRFAYNHAWHAHYDDPMRDEVALRKAWEHVKSRFRKAGENWLPIEQPG